jgi:Sulfotransferase family
MPDGGAHEDKLAKTLDQAMPQRATVTLSDTDTAPPKPVLFLHIPKTAGTSLLLMCRNTFGDHRVRRIGQVDDNIHETLDHIVEVELSGISCLAGHLPIHLFDNILDRFHPFTVLREPVARVLSLYRFMRTGDVAVPQRLGLRPDFSLGEFLDWGHPEVYSQVNNGMVRMLCGDPGLVDPGNSLLCDIGDHVDTLQRALINLERIDFGLTEEMPATLALARARWGVPYSLGEYRENTTTHGADDELALIHRIIVMNTADLVLYHKARAIFHTRVERQLLPDAMARDRWNSLSVFAPDMNRETAIGDIPGRTGFHDFEPDGLAWLHAERRCEIHFVLGQDLVRLRLRIYCLTARYPAVEIAVSVNERRLQTQISFEGDKWCWLETEHFETRDGLNRIMVQAPLFIPVTELQPGSKDKRRLGIALSHVQIGP